MGGGEHIQRYTEKSFLCVWPGHFSHVRDYLDIQRLSVIVSQKFLFSLPELNSVTLIPKPVSNTVTQLIRVNGQRWGKYSV